MTSTDKGSDQGAGEISMAGDRSESGGVALLTKQLFSSVFFGIASISIITVNKAVLTTFGYAFPFRAHQLTRSPRSVYNYLQVSVLSSSWHRAGRFSHYSTAVSLSLCG